MTTRSKRRKPRKSVVMVPKDMSRALSDLGVDPTGVRGTEIVARCPGHESMIGRPDRTPGSWSISTTTGEHYCFSCGFRGSFVSLAAHMLGRSVDNASMWVAQRGVRSLKEKHDTDSSGAPVEEEYRPTVEEASLVFYSQPPLKELERRKISPEASCHYGILWDEENREWILPIRDPRGVLWGWQRKGNNRVLNYPRGIRKGETLFGLSVLDSDTVVLVESPLDAARVRSAGVRGAVASFGSHARRDQLTLLVSHARAGKLILAMDNDDAGWSSVWNICQDIGAEKRVRVFNPDVYADGETDPGDLDDERVRQGVEEARLWTAYLSRLSKYRRRL